MLNLLRKVIPENFSLRRWYSFANALCAAIFYRFPARGLTIVGVTGTDGKTTTTQMIAHLLRQNEKKTLSISTAEIMLNDKILTADKRTTPSPWNLQKWLSLAKKEEISTVVLEVSSHALSQNRVFGIEFDVAVLTNITPEHLDYHRSMEEYANAKKRLFTRFLKKDGIAVLNKDDSFGKQWMKHLLCEKKTYSLENKSADFLAKNTRTADTGIFFEEEEKTVFIPVFGAFNAANAAAAILAVESVGIPRQKLLVDISFFPGVPGRMEKINAGQDFSVFIDFAIAPGALSQMLNSAKKIGKKVILVFGSPGTHPDPKIRAEMGRIAAQQCDITIITDDEPYFSNPEEIRRQLLSGAREAISEEEFAEKIWEIGNRHTAIETAIQKASEGDVVIISGMGHLKTRNIGGKEIPWSDKEIAKKILTTFSK